jgi:D-tyrosyl-tRNA(Tyr) deacylase
MERSEKVLGLRVATWVGLKPDFHRAMGSETSKAMYQEFLNRMKTTYKDDKVHDGVFGAMMVVDIQNDGPVTLELDSRKFTYVTVF